MAVSLNGICRDFGIRVFTYQGNEEYLRAIHREDLAQRANGFTFYSQGVPVIMFDADRPDDRIRVTAAHELGHLVLGHLTHRLAFWLGCWDSAEQEANIFAAALLSDELLSRKYRPEQAETAGSACDNAEEEEALQA